jgi:hypothetical protein
VQQNVTSGYISVATRAWRQCPGQTPPHDRFVSFSDADKLIYFGLIFSIFKHFENIHSQRERGFIDDESRGLGANMS